MVTELLTLRDLRVQTLKERKEGRLTKIPTSFFNQIKNLENQIRNVIEQSKDNVKRLEKSNSDMRKLMDLKLELHKLRERKLTDLAREKVNGQNPNFENVHSNESEYLDSICSVIEKHRENTLLSTDFEFIPENKPNLKNETVIEKKEEVKVEEKMEIQTQKNIKEKIFEPKFTTKSTLCTHYYPPVYFMNHFLGIWSGHLASYYIQPFIHYVERISCTNIP